MDNNFLAPLMEGFGQALQIRGIIQHQRMQSEALTRQKAQDERENRLQDMQIQRGNAASDIKTKMSLLEAGGKPVAADGTYQAQTPGGVGLGTALDQMVPGPQRVAVPADPDDTVKAPNGDSFRLPSMQERLTAATDADNRKSARKLAEQQVDIPGMGRMDQRAVPFVTSRENAKAADARLDKTQAFTGEQNDMNRGNQRDIANQNQDGQNTRQAKQQQFTHGENALTRAAADKRAATEKPALNALQKGAIEGTMKTAMGQAEAASTRALIAEKNRAKRMGEEPDADTVGQILSTRDQEKQLAHDSYRERMATGGVQVDPIDFAAQAAARLGAPKPAAAPGKPAPGKPAPAQAKAAATAPKVGDVRSHQGADYKFDGKQWGLVKK